MEDLDAARRRLRDRYVAGFAAKIDALVAAKRGLLTDPEESIAALRRIAHQMRGSGASYGFPEITDASAELEDASEDALENSCLALLSVLRAAQEAALPEKGRLLIVDDDEELSALIAAAARASELEVDWAPTCASGGAYLESQQYSLIVLDLVLPDEDGRNLLMRLKKAPATARTPVFVLSAKGSTQIKTECLALGADQFFEKPFDPDFLAAAISSRLDMERLHTSEARVDALTQLPNREAFRESFEQATAAATEDSGGMCLAILDIDFFKRFNDDFGHQVGDQVLRRFAQILRERLRQTDLPARWGGEEFVVLFRDSATRGATLALRSILRGMSTERFGSDGKERALSFSAGVVAVNRGEELSTAILRADRILYRAKSLGRNRVIDDESVRGEEPTRLLVIDDDPIMGRLVRQSFAERGVQVDWYAEGSAGLAAAERTPYQGVILDQMMPEMTGLEVLNVLRSRVAYRETPVVMLTSVGAEDSIERAFTSGADDYVQKPFRPRELVARMHRLLGRSSR